MQFASEWWWICVTKDHVLLSKQAEMDTGCDDTLQRQTCVRATLHRVFLQMWKLFCWGLNTCCIWCFDVLVPLIVLWNPGLQNKTQGMSTDQSCMLPRHSSYLRLYTDVGTRPSAIKMDWLFYKNLMNFAFAPWWVYPTYWLLPSIVKKGLSPCVCWTTELCWAFPITWCAGSFLQWNVSFPTNWMRFWRVHKQIFQAKWSQPSFWALPWLRGIKLE